jgi:D-tagatose-1,6-bisphosphate aldolase subunit GatZ/KbaZ
MNPSSRDYLTRMIAAQKRGEPQGIPSVCSANYYVVDTCAGLAARDGSVLLVESTCNQVNQYGGYSGMTPALFREYVGRIARQQGLAVERMILGGDHLGPNPWRRERAESAMAKACQLVRDCVAAGYKKIHLDASMQCADDDPNLPLKNEVVAGRVADLCRAAEEAMEDSGLDDGAPQYVIGTEVPAPGGATAEGDAPAVTSVEHAEETLELTRRAFAERCLDRAWERVIALVVQPGVEFGDDRIHEYRREAAAGLSRFIRGQGRLVYEVHSTDYQTQDALQQLVEDQFAILKVGPALTFALREALFALALIEEEWLGGDPGVEPSNLIAEVDRVMVENPEHWEKYYQGSERAVGLKRRYSFSDRVRYYWPSPALQEATRRLLSNLERHPAPYSLVSQFLPEQYQKLRSGELDNHPVDLIRDKIASVMAAYAFATGGGKEPLSPVGRRAQRGEERR